MCAIRHVCATWHTRTHAHTHDTQTHMHIHRQTHIQIGNCLSHTNTHMHARTHAHTCSATSATRNHRTEDSSPARCSHKATQKKKNQQNMCFNYIRFAFLLCSRFRCTLQPGACCGEIRRFSCVFVRIFTSLALREGSGVENLLNSASNDLRWQTLF
jgi:hypothetical protein